MELTRSYIITKSQLGPILLQREDLIKNIISPYFLLIYSIQNQFTKITVLPIQSVPVTKLLISGSIINQEKIAEILSTIETLHSPIIHTSGIVSIRQQYACEIFFIKSPNTNLENIRDKMSQIPELECTWKIIGLEIS